MPLKECLGEDVLHQMIISENLKGLKLIILSSTLQNYGKKSKWNLK